MALALILTALQVVATEGSVKQTYACEHLRSSASNPHTPVREDLTISRTGPSGEHAGDWTVAWTDQQATAAESFPATFGSMGGSVGLKLRDKQGKPREAFISFGDEVDEDGTRIAWLSLDKPSLWQPPGFFS